MGMRDLSGVMEMFQNWTLVIVAQLCKLMLEIMELYT